ncbi:MAG: DUF86 domain-containing protein [Endomicrobium sp.]|nr:DUF86 domain-containing protein [Endomicrobium sp.]
MKALEIIGEASKKMPSNIRFEYPEIPWKQIDGMRDKLIRDYFGVDVDVLWKTAKSDIAHIKIEFGNIIKDLKKNSYLIEAKNDGV